MVDELAADTYWQSLPHSAEEIAGVVAGLALEELCSPSPSYHATGQDVGDVAGLVAESLGFCAAEVRGHAGAAFHSGWITKHYGSRYPVLADAS